MEISTNMAATENMPANLKTIQEIIKEILDVNSSSIEKLQSINRVEMNETKNEIAVPHQGTMDQIYDNLKLIRKQSSTITQETNSLIGN